MPAHETMMTKGWGGGGGGGGGQGQWVRCSANMLVAKIKDREHNSITLNVFN